MSAARPKRKGKRCPGCTPEGCPKCNAEIRNRRVEANYGLVMSQASPHLDPDAFQEGVLGLMDAAELYDPSRGWQFSTYAHYGIKRQVNRHRAETSRLMRIPPYIWEYRNTYGHHLQAMQDQLGREVSPEEVLDDLGCKPRFKLRYLAFLASHPSSAVQAQTAIPPASPEEPRFDADEIAKAAERLCVLDEREREIVRRRLGLGRPAAQKLRDIGEAVGLTRERVRQIYEDAIAKMRRDAEFWGEIDKEAS